MEQCEEPRDSIHRLPTEILIKIFEYLDRKDKVRAACVCKQWRSTVYSRKLWQNEKILVNLNTLSTSRLLILRQRGIGHVVVTDCDRPRALRRLTIGLRCLRRLDIRSCGSLTKKTLERVFSKVMPRFAVLKMKVTEESCKFSLGWILDHLPNLEGLTLEGSFSNFTLLEHAARLKKLRRLKLWSADITDETVGFLGGIHNESGYSRDKASIQNLAVCGSSKLSNTTLMYLCKGFPNLVTLKLTHCTRVTQVGLRCLAHLRKMRYLTLSRGCMRDTDLVHLADDCKNLLRLNLDLHPHLGDDVVGSLSRLSSLTYLSLRGVILSKAAIFDLVNKLPKLQKLALCPIPSGIRDKINGCRPGSVIVHKIFSD